MPEMKQMYRLVMDERNVKTLAFLVTVGSVIESLRLGTISGKDCRDGLRLVQEEVMRSYESPHDYTLAIADTLAVITKI